LAQLFVVSALVFYHPPVALPNCSVLAEVWAVLRKVRTL